MDTEFFETIAMHDAASDPGADSSLLRECPCFFPMNNGKGWKKVLVSKTWPTQILLREFHWNQNVQTIISKLSLERNQRT